MTDTIRTMRLPAAIDAQCAAGDNPHLSQIPGLGWVVHPEEYDPDGITREDTVHDHALRVLTQQESYDVPRIEYPTAEDLDSGEVSETSGWACHLYLVPAAETESGVPRVETFYGFGNIGAPMPAFHARWALIGEYRAKVVGASVLKALREHEDELVKLSDAYRGAEWDGHNMRGKWDDPPAVYEYALDLSDCASYWDASDWFGPAAIGWEELCEEAGIDRERAVDCDDLEALCDEVAAIVEPAQDERVSGTSAYALAMARHWLSERDEEGA